MALWRCGVLKTELSGLNMGKKIANGNAVTTLAGDALAPRLGAAQPPLDLSLGHIGTTDKLGRRVFIEEGPPVFRLNVDSKKRTAVLTIDVTQFESADELQEALEEVMPLMVSPGGYPGYGPVPRGKS